MLETTIALLAAHLLADFLLQFKWIIERKRDPRVFALHILIVTVTAVLALGAFTPDRGMWTAIVIVAASHALLDGVKTYAFTDAWLAARPRWRFSLFVADQIGHLASIAIAAFLAPSAFAAGAWAGVVADAGEAVVIGMAVFAGWLAASRMGEFLIGDFMKRFDSSAPEMKSEPSPKDADLPDGGAWIGLLERTLVFGAVLLGQFTAIGFLLAAKSILRFSSRGASEYVIIGTLASFGWAIGVALVTRQALGALSAS